MVTEPEFLDVFDVTVLKEMQTDFENALPMPAHRRNGRNFW
jgi:hypothetical protein